ncbi:MAG TPA: hypothetical protein VK560_01360, partial [Gemmatimonadaceae bacterium]|nr:hypothetical protein [Gemmatimonadaceae bacterium]
MAPRTDPTLRKDPATVLFADLDTELATTRRMLERVPDGKDDWRPHKKSRTLDELTVGQLVLYRFLFAAIGFAPAT